MDQENNRSFTLNENIEIRYDCLRQECITQNKCIQSCFILSKISYIARIYQKMMSENVEANQHLSWLTIKRHAKYANNLNIWVKNDFVLEKPRPNCQKKKELHHTGKGEETKQDVKCYFCFRKYRKQKISGHVMTHKQMKVEKVQKQGKQSYQYFCECLVCKYKMQTFQWPRHVLNAHRYDLVFISILLRKDNPIMYGKWYFEATNVIAQAFRPKYIAAVDRNIKHNLVQKMVKAKKQYRCFGKTQQPEKIYLEDPSQLNSSQVPNVEFKIDLPPPPEKPYDGDQIRQERLRIQKQRRQQKKRIRDKKILTVQQLAKKERQKFIITATYKQFARIHYQKYRLQYPRYPESELILKILKEWQGKSKQQWFKLYQQYKQHQNFMDTCRFQGQILIDKQEDLRSENQYEHRQQPMLPKPKQYNQWPQVPQVSTSPVRRQLEIGAKFKSILIPDKRGGLRLLHPLQKCGRVFYVEAERDQFLTHIQCFERYGGQFIRYHKDLEGHVLGYYVKRLRAGQKARRICLQG